MFPGFTAASRMIINTETSYAEAMALVTNKTLWARADPSTAANGATLTTVPLVGDVGGNVSGAATWATNSQGGKRGILSDASGEYGNVTALTLNNMMPTDQTYTMFAVEKRSGLQGSSANAYSNSASIVDSGRYFALCFLQNSRQFALYHYHSAVRQVNTSFSFTDGIPYVIAARVDAGGGVRVNFKGTVLSTSFSQAAVNPDSKTGVVQLNYCAAGSNLGYEYIFSSDPLSDVNIDKVVNALRAKWAI